MATKEEILEQIQPGKVITAKLLTDITNLAANAQTNLPTLQGQVSELKEDLGNLATFGNNLFNKDTAIIGYTLTSTGEITNDNSVVKNANQYLTSDFIPCDKYTGWFFCIAPQNGSVCFYDGNKTFISKVDNILYSNGRKVVNGAKYLRFTTPKSELDTTTARVFDTMPIEAPAYDDYGVKINDDVNVNIKDDRIFVGDKIPNGGTNDGDQTISIGDGACKDERCGIIAIGVNAGAKTVSTDDSDNGHYSVAIGHRALGQNTTGDHNTAIGWGCMANNKTGNGNTAVGEDAMCQGNGDGNTCIGNRAYQTGMGSRNVAVGALSMYAGGDSANLHSGVENVSVGNASGCSRGSGSWNTCIGHEAQIIENIDRSIAIGYRAKARKSQQAVIGYTTNDTRYRILETLLNGDIVIHGTDNKFRKLTFNDDGSIGWIDVSSDYSDYINN